MEAAQRHGRAAEAASPADGARLATVNVVHTLTHVEPVAGHEKRNTRGAIKLKCSHVLYVQRLLMSELK